MENLAEKPGPKPEPMSQEEMEEFLAAQKEDMVGEVNKWYAGEKLGHEPTPSEAALHYVTSGGAEKFRKNWEERKRAAKEGSADSN